MCHGSKAALLAKLFAAVFKLPPSAELVVAMIFRDVDKQLSKALFEVGAESRCGGFDCLAHHTFLTIEKGWE